MQRHDYFEQLSSLSLIGDLSPEQISELNDHLAGCSECRGSQAEFRALANDFLTVEDRSKLQASPEEDSQIPLLRERVISSARNQGLRISEEAIIGSHSLLERFMDFVRRARWEFRQWLPRAAVAVSVAALIATSGILVEKLTYTRNELNEFKIHAARAKNGYPRRRRCGSASSASLRGRRRASRQRPERQYRGCGPTGRPGSP